jgi:hypothetical protein
VDDIKPGLPLFVIIGILAGVPVDELIVIEFISVIVDKFVGLTLVFTNNTGSVPTIVTLLAVSQIELPFNVPFLTDIILFHFILVSQSKSSLLSNLQIGNYHMVSISNVTIYIPLSFSLV